MPSRYGRLLFQYLGFFSITQTSFSTRRLLLNGPVPGMSTTRRRLYWLSSSVFLRTMPFQPLANAAIMKLAGLGSESLNTTVFLSGALISATVVNKVDRGIMTPDRKS